MVSFKARNLAANETLTLEQYKELMKERTRNWSDSPIGSGKGRTGNKDGLKIRKE